MEGVNVLAVDVDPCRLVPDAYTLVGIADVHDVLQEGEIYGRILSVFSAEPVLKGSVVCIRRPGEEPFWLSGPYLITRSPMIHPGDIQFVHAIGAPQRSDSPYGMEPLPNCIVFPCKGARPLPNCLGGGDLGSSSCLP